MAQPILKIERNEKKTAAVANILPCRIDHNGPVDPISPYWIPIGAPDGSKTAYFRGRKLQGKTVRLPEQFRGVVVEKKEDKAHQPELHTHDQDGDEKPQSVGTLQTTAEFDEIVVWGHESIADATGDVYIRSMEEWLHVADQIHSYPEVADGASN
ncbi:hypothetical protein G7046_g2406 [Stylonectria norvegica]|nr:hypothetical protein G7046_g2406 [Stylonectria norvegica]